MNPEEAAIQALAANQTQNAESHIARIIFDGVLVHRKELDSLSEKLFLVVGASFALVVPNIGDLSPILSADAVRNFLFLLTASAVSGIFQKWFAFKTDSMLRASVAVERPLTELLERVEEMEAATERHAALYNILLERRVSVKRALGVVLAAFPFWIRWPAERAAAKSKDDPLKIYRDSAAAFWQQGVFLTVQALLFLAGIVWIAISIRS